jgi:hypothetical protein
MESLRDWLERMLIPIGEKDLVAVREQTERKVATPSELPLAVFHADVAPADRRPLVIDNVAFRSQTTVEHGARQLILQVNLAESNWRRERRFQDSVL